MINDTFAIATLQLILSYAPGNSKYPVCMIACDFPVPFSVTALILTSICAKIFLQSKQKHDICACFDE